LNLGLELEKLLKNSRWKATCKMLCTREGSKIVDMMHSFSMRIIKGRHFVYVLHPLHLSQNWLDFLKDKSQTYNIVDCYIYFDIIVTEVSRHLS
jgi:hypothetical protein